MKRLIILAVLLVSLRFRSTKARYATLYMNIKPFKYSQILQSQKNTIDYVASCIVIDMATI